MPTFLLFFFYAKLGFCIYTQLRTYTLRIPSMYVEHTFHKRCATEIGSSRVLLDDTELLFLASSQQFELASDAMPGLKKKEFLNY